MTGTVQIHALGPQGDGIHNSERGAIYIERALPGDVLDARIQRGSGGVLRGDITKIMTPSPHRVAPPCVNYSQCGGCSLQHADTAFYRAWKLGLVRTALTKANLAPAHWDEPVFVPEGTRRRVTFAAYKKGDLVTLGYFQRRSHMAANIDTCLIADPAVMALRATLAPLLMPLLPGGKLVDVFIQNVDGQFDVVITGPIGAKGSPDLRVYETAATVAHGAKICRLSWRAREADAPDVLVEINPVIAKFGALSVSLPPLAFLQPTQLGETALRDAIVALLPAKGKFADLFSGSGTFSGPMLGRGTVDAYESNESAVHALDRAKGAKPLKAVRRDLFRQPLQTDELNRYDAVVFDPPRAGAEQQVTTLAASKVPQVIGVSCNPVTFARDARILVDGGYTLDRVKVIDQFTWSHHLELVASFRKP